MNLENEDTTVSNITILVLFALVTLIITIVQAIFSKRGRHKVTYDEVPTHWDTLPVVVVDRVFSDVYDARRNVLEERQEQ